METRIRGVLGELGGLAKPIDQVGADEDLFAAGFTSLAIVSVLIAIEDEFEVEIPDSLLKRETFRSIATLGGVIEGLKTTHAV